jgi:hypothetical protein
MAEQLLQCPDCGTDYTIADNYCRKCGMYVAALRDVAVVQLPPPEPPARYERPRAPLPAPVKKAATALAIGTALQIGVNLAGRYLAGQAANKATNAIRPSVTSRRPSRTVAEPANEPIAVSETVMVRRVWIRRG